MLRTLTIVFVVVTAITLWPDVAASMRAGSLTFMPLGQLWFDLDPASLNLAQAIIERYVTPVLWDPVMVSALLAPACTVPAVLAAGFGALWFMTGRRSKARAR